MEESQVVQDYPGADLILSKDTPPEEPQLSDMLPAILALSEVPCFAKRFFFGTSDKDDMLARLLTSFLDCIYYYTHHPA